ncbi:hypothetical protein HIM_00991 [Hirsutella minnesotensis 3608]|nr:hypothetical protein HIM_00991 [Hirsutella minnesotensis 3608]
MPPMGSGLGNAALLAKIDKLRELNVGSLIPLPQLVVVGDQSSGKSSVLESLTGFSFPRDVGLCTRYATQITCCRDPVKSITISIIPRPDADEELKAQLLGFKRQVKKMSNEDLATIFQEANTAMGIRMSMGSAHGGRSAFSQDILKIEVHGPDQSHLTVIDVPGIFRVPTPGLTTETDITLVENMVKSYMSNSRTIILAVMPCNVDIATQEILKLAEAADPEGTRTMGVLTKPDLATEVATRQAVLDLVAGKRSNLKLGYFVVKNRSADDMTSTLAERAEAENAFFMAPPWNTIGDRCGITALKDRLRRLLMKISKEELPHVKAEIEERLARCRADLEAMGPARSDQSAQRQYLGRLAGRFQTVAQAALNGYYSGEKIFTKVPELKLITRILHLNEEFSNVVWGRGHLQHFDDPDNDGGVTLYGDKATDLSFKIPLEKHRELSNIILTEDYDCPKALKTPIMEYIQEVYRSSRGPELGTYGGTILATVFERQSEKWEPLAISHASKAIALVHDFLFTLLTEICPEKQVRDQLWDNLLIEKLGEKYRIAVNHTRFLLAIERGGRPSTFNHEFNETLQKKRADRAYEESEESQSNVSSPANTACEQKSSSQQVCEDVLDTLTSYYKISRKRFVDMVCQQVVSFYLLDGEKSPIKVFSPDFVMGLDADQLDAIAGEDDESKEQRQILEREKQSLEAAISVLRS